MFQSLAIFFKRDINFGNGILGSVNINFNWNQMFDA